MMAGTRPFNALATTARLRLTAGIAEPAAQRSLAFWVGVATAVLAATVLFLAAARRNSSASSGLPGAIRSQTDVPARPASPEEPVETELRNVDFHVDSGAVLHIRRLRGELLRTEKSTPATFDDKTSFSIKIDSALIGITAGNLAALMNGYVFAYRGAPLRNLKLSLEGNRLILEGDLMKGLGIPFEAEGELSATASGLIRLQLTHIKSAHVPVKGLMDLLGVKMADLINLNQSRGARVEGDDVLLDPERIIPPPRVRGRVTVAGIEGEEIVLHFGPEGGKSSPKPLSPPRPDAPNYMYFRGGTLRFGKLTMTDADLQIIDTDPRDSFDFDLGQYNIQLVAGYSKTTPTYGLIVFMPDLHRISRTSRN